jgi:two-component system, LuxR family, response regulator FixJ
MREPVVHVIDDDAALRESFEMLLEFQGIKVHSYASAEEFCRKAAPLPIDCLIIDIDMPGASGVDLLDLLRTNGVITPALFITGRRISENLRSAADRLAAAFFEKPILPEELISTVREALG